MVIVIKPSVECMERYFIMDISQGKGFLGIQSSTSFMKVFSIFVILIALIITLFVRMKHHKRLKRKYQFEYDKFRDHCQSLEEQNKQLSDEKIQIEEQLVKLKKNQEHIKNLAYYDYLTQLPNRISFNEILENVLCTLRQEEIIAVMDIDLDDFKVINDTLGHSYGDELLIDVTHRLKQVITEDDYLARIGGDEFIILTQNIMNFENYKEKIERIRKVFSYPFILSTQEFFITVSIGVVVVPENGKSTQALIKNVDTAMYAAKAKGKDNVSFFDESMNANLMKKIELQSKLRKAIDRKEFVAYYQPQIQLKDNRLVGFEALIRWIHEDGTITSPADFIPIAEETGLIVPIGQYILIEACKELKYWNEKGYTTLTMAVNLSPRQFRDRDFVQMLQDIIDEVGVNPKNLELEITETLALEDIEFTIHTIERLQQIGVRFSLDDFGTGYSSMRYLKDLPIDILKIDKSFLDALMENESEQRIVQTIITMAQILNLEVIAEGVEKEEQADYLKSANCNKAQGYLYSCPVPANEAYELIKQYNSVM